MLISPAQTAGKPRNRPREPPVLRGERAAATRAVRMAQASEPGRVKTAVTWDPDGPDAMLT
jgi:hypothetical protein